MLAGNGLLRLSVLLKNARFDDLNMLCLLLVK
jgi:hypothetical protein